MIIINKLFSGYDPAKTTSTISSLEQSVKDARRRNRKKPNNSSLGEIESNQDKLSDLEKDVKKYRKKHEGHDREYGALLGKINKEQRLLKYQEKRSVRDQNREAELSDISRARAIEDQEGAGNSFKRKLEDAKLSAKYKLQDMSDNYFKNTGRSMGGDAALGAAALGGGYLAYKAIKKARYEKKLAKDRAENKFIR